MFVNLKEGQLEELLHIPEPWYIRQMEFSLEAKQLDVYVKFRKRALFSCAKCGSPINQFGTSLTMTVRGVISIFLSILATFMPNFPEPTVESAIPSPESMFRGHWINRSITFPCTSMHSSSNWPRICR